MLRNVFFRLEYYLLALCINPGIAVNTIAEVYAEKLYCNAYCAPGFLTRLDVDIPVTPLIRQLS